MTGTLSVILIVIVCMVAVSYGWGMRGDLIGGEEGAMLPGALLGFFIALLLGKDFFNSSALLMVSLGAVGMFFGGTETYAETFDFTYWKDGDIKTASNLKKGLLGLAIKGAPWYGICAAVLGIGLSAASGRVYKPHQLIILIVLIPVVRYIGVKLLDTPYDPDKGIFPKYYFSITRPEEWGGLWFILVTFLIFEALCNDFSSLVITLFGMVGGSLGWIIAQLLQCFTRAKMKNGKYFFGIYQEQGRIDNWKLMECVYGALGSFFIAMGFVICKKRVVSLAILTHNGNGFNIPDGLQTALFVVWLLLFAADVYRNFVTEKYGKLKKALEVLHRPVLCYIPMLLMFLGNADVVKFMALTVLFWQAVEELCFVQLKKRYNIFTASVISCILLAIVAIYTLLLPSDGINAKFFYFFICVLYLFCASFANIAAVYGLEDSPRNIKDLVLSMGPFITVKLYYIFCIIFTTIFVITF